MVTGGRFFMATHTPSSLASRLAQPVERRLVDVLEQPPDRRVRGHLPEQRGLVPQRDHVRDADPAAGQHHRHLGQQPAPIVDKRPPPGKRHRRRVLECQPSPLGNFPQKM
jgi:hypothetical protein